MYLDEDLYNKAFADFNSILELKPDDGMVYFSRGAAYQIKGESKKALADFKKSERLGFYIKDFVRKEAEYILNRK